MRKYQRIDFDRGWIDVLFAAALAITMMFALAIIQLNPKIQNQGNVKKEADFVIELEWPSQINCDVDLWVMDPTGAIGFYGNKDIPLMNLERDDLGHSTDTLIDVDGKRILVNENKEITTLRGTIQGMYVVNTHLYACREETGNKYELGTNVEVPVTVTLIQINPDYRQVVQKKYTLNSIWEEKTAFSFEINPNKNVTNLNTEDQIGLLELRIKKDE